MNDSIAKIRANVSKVLVGKEEVLDLLLAALFAGGHVLLEDVPGMGKTVLAKALAKSLSLKFKRIQFTPDLLPSDVTGLSYYNQAESKFIFQEGPVFSNLLLADEINRATPRTQSSLLECMSEGQVTVDGKTRKLAAPFFVIATQNPVETLGCFPLPEAQLDRFLMKLSMGSLTAAQERQMIDSYIHAEPLEEIEAVCSIKEILDLQSECRQVFVHDELRDYIVALAQETRKGSAKIAMNGGVSPRGTLALLRAAQGYALVKDRDYVVPEDIKTVAVEVMAHRYLSEDSSALQKRDYINMVLERIAVPTEDWRRQ